MSKNLYLFSFLLINVFAAIAQKLPNVQTATVLAPSNIKIDGKIAEWDNRFQAFNKTVRLAYTLANDNENLYLVVKATEPRVIEKILCVGVTLIVNKAGVKDEKDKGNTMVNYPVMNRNYIHGILVNAGEKANWPGMSVRSSMFVETLTRADSTVTKANEAYDKYVTTIKAFGLKGETDTLFSIYNQQRIRAAGFFDNKGGFSCELAVPLKYFNFANNEQSFSYGIRLNAWGYEVATFTPIDPVTRQLIGEPQDANPDLNTTTYMWGDYTLAKKP